MVNRTQALVLGFFLVAFGSLVVILTAAPDVYDQELLRRDLDPALAARGGGWPPSEPGPAKAS